VLSIFQKFDQNGDGLIEMEELRRVLLRLQDFDTAHVEALFKAADLDQDGLINAEEFVEWILRSDDNWSYEKDTIKNLRDRSSIFEDGESFQLSVQDLAGPVFELAANTAWTVAYTKLMVADIAEIPPEQQDIGARWQDVSDTQKLKEIRAQGISELQLIDKRKLAEAGCAGGARTEHLGERLRMKYFYGIDIIDLF